MMITAENEVELNYVQVLFSASNIHDHLIDIFDISLQYMIVCARLRKTDA